RTLAARSFTLRMGIAPPTRIAAGAGGSVFGKCASCSGCSVSSGGDGRPHRLKPASNTRAPPHRACERSTWRSPSVRGELVLLLEGREPLLEVPAHHLVHAHEQ